MKDLDIFRFAEVRMKLVQLRPWLSEDTGRGSN